MICQKVTVVFLFPTRNSPGNHGNRTTLLFSVKHILTKVGGGQDVWEGNRRKICRPLPNENGLLNHTYFIIPKLLLIFIFKLDSARLHHAYTNISYSNYAHVVFYCTPIYQILLWFLHEIWICLNFLIFPEENQSNQQLEKNMLLLSLVFILEAAAWLCKPIPSSSVSAGGLCGSDLTRPWCNQNPALLRPC